MYFFLTFLTKFLLLCLARLLNNSFQSQSNLADLKTPLFWNNFADCALVMMQWPRGGQFELGKFSGLPTSWNKKKEQPISIHVLGHMILYEGPRSSISLPSYESWISKSNSQFIFIGLVCSGLCSWPLATASSAKREWR